MVFELRREPWKGLQANSEDDPPGKGLKLQPDAWLGWGIQMAGGTWNDGTVDGRLHS